MHYLDPPKDHSHYGPETLDALYAFQDAWKAYFNKTWISFQQESSFQLDSMQSAWNKLARERIKETGTPFYLTKEQYQNGNYRRLSNPKSFNW